MRQILTPTPWRYRIISTNEALYVNDFCFVDTSAAVITLTLPIAAKLGDTLYFSDLKGKFSLNHLIIARNGHKIMGLDEDMAVDKDNVTMALIYANSENGWRIL